MVPRPGKLSGARRAVQPGISPKTWASRHVQTLVGSLGRLYQHPFATFMTVAVIGIALAMPAGLHLLVVNGTNLGGRWDSAVDIAVYLKPGTSIEDTETLADAWRKRDDVADARVVPADRALEDFKTSSGFGGAFEGLAENPLPHTVVVRPAVDRLDAEQVQQLERALGAATQVDLVQADTQWVQRFYAIIKIVQRLVTVAAFALALAVVVIIGNTIRLDIYSRREEIEIAKLIGATDAFIRRPFLYSGTWYGLGGALVALLLVSALLFLVQGPVTRLAGLYGSSFQIAGLGAGDALLLLAAGAALGWLGSWIAAARHIRRLEPA